MEKVKLKAKMPIEDMISKEVVFTEGEIYDGTYDPKLNKYIVINELKKDFIIYGKVSCEYFFEEVF